MDNSPRTGEDHRAASAKKRASFELTISISHHRRWRLRYEPLIKALPLALSNPIEAANRLRPARRAESGVPVRYTTTRFPQGQPEQRAMHNIPLARQSPPVAMTERLNRKRFLVYPGSHGRRKKKPPAVVGVRLGDKRRCFLVGLQV
ncbi:MAG: hypothetical protein KDD44_10270 [Bdellovibrionales bacterium]|nr:hypothetical protein [Bdellovibrionales bacterium]